MPNAKSDLRKMTIELNEELIELVDVVDESDSVLETRRLDECQRLGLLHRAVTVFLRNSKGELFLQQRGKNDDWLPGYWTASCTGHVKSREDATKAAKREMEEELGISCEPSFLFKFVVPTVKFMDKIERELDIVFEATSDDLIHIDPREVEAGTFMSIAKCKEFFNAKKNKITLDARLAFERYVSINRL